MKLVIIDPGYAHTHAHHETVNTMISRVMQKHCNRVLVLAAHDFEVVTHGRSIAAGMAVLPWFRTPAYPKNAESLEQDTHEALSRQFSDELIALYNTGLLQGTEHVLIHTAYSFHFAGLARALWHLGDRVSGRVILCAMFNPGARVRSRADNDLECFDLREYLRYKMTFRLLESICGRGDMDIQLATSCRAYQNTYQSLWNLGEVQIHPAVGYQCLSTHNVDDTPRRPRVLLYLGGAKSSKGIGFAARLGAKAAKSLPDAEFIFHFNNEFPDAERFSPLIDDLQSAGKEHGNVQVLTGNLNVNDYDELLLTSSVICVLYDPQEYKFKTSGVFWDALRCTEKAWLVTAQTWPEDELKEIGIPHASVAYGDVPGAISALDVMLKRVAAADRGHLPSGVDIPYLRQINRPFGDWLQQRLVSKRYKPGSGVVAGTKADPLSERGRILVVRTNYGHFGQLSGPGGFIPYLRDMGYSVDEKFVDLGVENLPGLSGDLLEEFTSLTQAYLNSYQGNAVITENEIQHEAHLYDIVHFVDGEHCGLLSALYRLYAGFSKSTKLVATYHQPASIMEQLVGNPDYLRGFDRIQLMSPCQAAYFDRVVGSANSVVVPHGLAAELLDDTPARVRTAAKALKTVPGFRAATRNKKILLTVGNWLRDFDSLLQTAGKLSARTDVIFVVVSRGLELDTQMLNNVLLLNQGVSDEQLHALYMQATLLFLPLQDGAANNAVLEAMAHGLPIVATDIPATGYYTDGLAMQSPTGASAYADALERALVELAQPGRRIELRDTLRTRAQALVWKQVANTMHEFLYAPLIDGTGQPESEFS